MYGQLAAEELKEQTEGEHQNMGVNHRWQRQPLGAAFARVKVRSAQP